MKKTFISKEKHKLPLTYKYMEIVKNKSRGKQHMGITVECEKYQTDFHVTLKPNKFLTRLL